MEWMDGDFLFNFQKCELNMFLCTGTKTVCRRRLRDQLLEQQGTQCAGKLKVCIVMPNKIYGYKNGVKKPVVGFSC
jgi:hypothetical protein